ncbi:MAG: hypothetical protein AABY89_06050 [Acidobacteriota bacterium]
MFSDLGSSAASGASMTSDRMSSIVRPNVIRADSSVPNQQFGDK